MFCVCKQVHSQVPALFVEFSIAPNQCLCLLCAGSRSASPQWRGRSWRTRWPTPRSKQPAPWLPRWRSGQPRRRCSSAAAPSHCGKGSGRERREPVSRLAASGFFGPEKTAASRGKAGCLVLKQCLSSSGRHAQRRLPAGVCAHSSTRCHFAVPHTSAHAQNMSMFFLDCVGSAAGPFEVVRGSAGDLGGGRAPAVRAAVHHSGGFVLMRDSMRDSTRFHAYLAYRPPSPLSCPVLSCPLSSAPGISLLPACIFLCSPALLLLSPAPEVGPRREREQQSCFVLFLCPGWRSCQCSSRRRRRWRQRLPQRGRRSPPPRRPWRTGMPTYR